MERIQVMEEQITFQNKQGEKLSAILHVPENPKKRAVIECHGFKANKDWSWIKDICERVSEEGYTVLRFDFSGNGKSEGKFEDSNYTKQISDLQSAMDFLETKGYEEFTLIGHSMGGAIILITASQDKRAKLVIPISAPANPASMEKRLFGDQAEKIKKTGEGTVSIEFGGVHIKVKVTKEWIDDLKKYNTVESIEKVNVPVYIIHGDEDETVSFREGEDIFNAANEPKFFEVIKCGDHALSQNKHRTKLIELIVKAIKEWTQSA